MITDVIDLAKPAAIRVGAMILMAVIAIWFVAGRRR